ncbi:hypothetical protein SanaruYs_26120 [Chryseotalea sanaruensis]|uniref:DUF4252 domain-containing protein n=1 Tax=Chryseotalea sanaruensis TaxID=2482724 RepID=A0A401UBY1_9BACT|nr:DUF4252 domain-containing protein [Chryseotalea sanaruensis]GCC52375.1 hypothetical protein SanaruYs_26120 [Chryseotalea sanaruensis]
MKTFIVSMLVLLTVSAANSQHNSIRVLKDRFRGEADVHSFKVEGFMARLALKMIDDHEFKEAISGVRSIEFITIPKEAFAQQRVSVSGYKKFLEENNFETLMEVKDNGEVVSFMLAPGKNRDYYVVIVDGAHEVVVFELKGYIDPALITSGKITSASL